MTSRLNEVTKNAIVKKIERFYKKALTAVSQHAGGINVGGKIRYSMGAFGEDLTKIAWTEVAKLYADVVKPAEPKKGEKDKKRCTNDKGNTYDAHVDKHCYIGNKFVLAVECKSYLDACYYARASSDFRLLKKYYDQNLTCIVISIEEAAKESSKKFIEDEGWVNGCFILTDGKRSSAKPIWDPRFRKELNQEKTADLVVFLDGLYCSNL